MMPQTKLWYHRRSWLEMWPFRRHNLVPSDIELQDCSSHGPLCAHQQRYLELLFGLTESVLIKYPGSRAYCQYLQGLFRPLMGDDYSHLWNNLDLPRPSTPQDCWPWLNAVLESLRLETKPPEDVSIDLVMKNVLKRGEHPETGQNTGFSQIAVFAVLCWATMILNPTLGFQDQLQLTCKFSDRPNGERAMHLMLHECRRAISVTLRRFKAAAWGEDVMNCRQPNTEENEDLYVACLNCNSLQLFGKIRIQWVTTMTAHLEFDPGSRQLSLFRFPSFCALKAEQENEDICPILQRTDQDFDPLPADDTTHRYISLEQEILLSYRLLFAQSASSREVAHRELGRLKRDGLPFDDLLTALCEHKHRKGVLGWFTSDEALGVLPAAAWPVSCRDSDQRLQEREVYSAREDFPRLGRRLALVQRFNLRQRPSRLTDLWRDRRNPLQWYTFWAVLVIGGLANVIAIAQLVVALYQVVSPTN